ncbi:S-type pyocin domain-containing protein [Pragia fontium]|uniref:S-type pyocin domain-containing protein n=1 Tax=Pragia fontium TaxID=82985 RepID=UPI000F70E159|nr:S-type pyocin domain-containing protein [Pragia fontium]VEJ56540.1 Pyocin-S2 [Pragia fontium]
MPRMLACLGNKTTKGTIIHASSTLFEGSHPLARDGDLAWCNECKNSFPMLGTATSIIDDRPMVAFGDKVLCLCSDHWVIAQSTWFCEHQDSGKESTITNQQSFTQSNPPSLAELSYTDNSPSVETVFAKSCLLSDGCTDAGQEQEPVENFGEVSLFQGTDIECGYRCEPSPSPQITSMGALIASQTGIRVLQHSAGTSIAGRWMVSNPISILLIGLFYSPEISQGSHRDGLADYIARDKLDYLATTGGTATTRVRFQARVNIQTNQPVIEGYHTPANSELDQVPVIKMRLDSSNGIRRYIPEGQSGPSIIWTPAEPEYSPINHTGNHSGYSAPLSILVNPLPETPGDHSTTSPIPEKKNFNDYILVFPADSGMPPIYIMLDSPRNESGVVIGQGETIFGTWLRDAGAGLGCPVPAQIADKLRGREFTNFDQFREAFWIEVSKDAELSSQFIPSNRKKMANGRAPRARYRDTVGGRRSFELHHKHQIQHGGNVYDVENLNVVTPKRHIDIHRDN